VSILEDDNWREALTKIWQIWNGYEKRLSYLERRVAELERKQDVIIQHNQAQGPGK
jgi:hypothetical protein